MECTQRLECTEDLCGARREEVIPEQIGFLGICGQRYPVLRGPNKIGRDPSCRIILNLNSVSRHHAIINVVTRDNIMLMDLDSSNKTKLLGKTLQSYIPQPLHNGDTVQFGDVFGIFRKLEEADDLPETQAIEIPETPVPNKHMSRLHGAIIVPESPDVSDKDDSFIVPSQPKGPQVISTRFVKPGRTISILPVGSNRIDNVYWYSSKKSTSLNLDDSTVSLNDSLPPINLNDKENIINTDIHELATQLPPGHNLGDKSTDSIFAADTQIPKDHDTSTINTLTSKNCMTNYAVHNAMLKGKSNEIDNASGNIYELETQLPPGHNLGDASTDSIFNANTQMPEDCQGSIPIQNVQLCKSDAEKHNLNTQLLGENLPEVRKINAQQDMQFDLCAEERNNINTSSPQVNSNKHNQSNDIPKTIDKPEIETSNDEVLFDELEESFDDNFESQAILTEDIELPINQLVEPDFEPMSQIVQPKSAKRNMRILSDDSEPVHNLQAHISNKKMGDDDTTDCEEDNMIELKTVLAKRDVRVADTGVDLPTKLAVSNEDAQTADTNDVSIEDMPTQVIINNEYLHSGVNNDVDLTEMPTQVIINSDIAPPVVSNNVDIEDMPTQVLVMQDDSKTDDDLDISDQLTQVLEVDESLKQQLNTSLQINNKENNSIFKIPSFVAIKAKKRDGPKKLSPQANSSPEKIIPKVDEKYYDCTQDIHDDLCTQKLDFEEAKSINEMSMNKEKSCHGRELSLKDKVESHHVSNQESLEIAGESNQVDQLKRTSSDSSIKSLENTPKKQRPLKLMDIDLPDSQEIKISVSQNSKVVANLSSSDSEPEENPEDHTPIVYRKKQKSKPDAKLNLIAKFNPDILPTRVITRVRKPTPKIKEHQNKKAIDILKPAFLTEQDSDVDKDIIIENITRLKSKHEKNKSAEKSRSTHESFQLDKSGNTLTNEKPVEIMAVSETGKKMRSCRRKATESNSKSKAENVKKTDEPKINESKKRDTRNNRKHTDSKTEIPDKNAKTKINTTSSRDSTPVEEKRSSRSRDAKTTRTKEKSPEKDPQTEKHKRKYTRNTSKSTNVENTNPPSEAEVPKRKRGRPTKEDVRKQTERSTSKGSATKKSDQSVVYDLALSLGSKRHCLDDSDVPTAKRLRSNVMPVETSSIRASGTQYVLFTAFNAQEVGQKLKVLGVETVTDVTKCSVVMTKCLKRTFKLLCAIGLGKPIVGPEWVQACVNHKCVVDPWQYLIKDEVAEKRFRCSLERTLKGKRNFLKGYNITSTPSVVPKAEEMKLIVECSGGRWGSGGSHWVCISCPQDSALWPDLRRRGATIANSEFIFMGVMQQQIYLTSSFK